MSVGSRLDPVLHLILHIVGQLPGPRVALGLGGTGGDRAAGPSAPPPLRPLPLAAVGGPVGRSLSSDDGGGDLFPGRWPSFLAAMTMFSVLIWRRHGVVVLCSELGTSSVLRGAASSGILALQLRRQPRVRPQAVGHGGPVGLRCFLQRRGGASCCRCWAPWWCQWLQARRPRTSASDAGVRPRPGDGLHLGSDGVKVLWRRLGNPARRMCCSSAGWKG
jgi:hypothetical protein